MGKDLKPCDAANILVYMSSSEIVRGILSAMPSAEAAAIREKMSAFDLSPQEWMQMEPGDAAQAIRMMTADKAAAILADAVRKRSGRATSHGPASKIRCLRGR